MSQNTEGKPQTDESGGAVGGVINVDGPIRRTNRLFIALRSYGHCDENGKAVCRIDCSSKKIPAPPDRPLALIEVLIEDLLPIMGYSSRDAMENDLRQFKEYAASLKING